MKKTVWSVTWLLSGLIIALCLTAAAPAEPKRPAKKLHILVVSSYHREYVSSQDSQKGFCDAMLKYGYFDNRGQADEYMKTDQMETSRVVVRNFWMDAKRRGGRTELEARALAIYKTAKEFHPDLVFLADDEAGEHLGRIYLDTKIPVVFWGFNDNSVMYGLVDSAERPGHNVTGVYESGYYIESLRLLKTLAPQVRTIAVLSDATVSGRTHYKALDYLARKGMLPLEITDAEATNSFEVWKKKALEFQKKADALYVLHFTGLKDEEGKYVSSRDVAKWYTANITVPEATRGHYVKIGLLCAADDSMYKQAYEAVGIAHDILDKGSNPATYATRTPSRGALMVNRTRAKQLGITLTDSMGIEELIEEDTPSEPGTN